MSPLNIVFFFPFFFFLREKESHTPKEKKKTSSPYNIIFPYDHKIIVSWKKKKRVPIKIIHFLTWIHCVCICSWWRRGIIFYIDIFLWWHKKHLSLEAGVFRSQLTIIRCCASMITHTLGHVHKIKWCVI